MAEKFKELLRDYRDGRITRREFMRQAVAITGSLVGANHLLEQRAQPNAYAAQAHVVDDSGSSSTYKIYFGAPRDFHTVTSPDRYHPEAAKEAWAKTLDFFKKNLQS